jgi:hypothetical protein
MDLNNKRQEQVGGDITSCRIFFGRLSFKLCLSSHVSTMFLVGDPEFKGVGV